MNLVVIGLTLSSSWGNGHATTYRALLKYFARLGHEITFLECDKEWFASNRDMPAPPFARLELYSDTSDLKNRFHDEIKHADAVIVGSYVPDGIAVGHFVCEMAHGVTAFYDIDTPVTLANLVSGDCPYVSPELIPRYHLYLSFSGGRSLHALETTWKARAAKPLYCAVDTELYFPEAVAPVYEMGYLGTYSPDRQPTVKNLLLEPASVYTNKKRPGTFAIAGAGYSDTADWAENVVYRPHLSPDKHRRFYAEQRFTLNVTRADMKGWGHSPSVRLFEAAACGVPIVSDVWDGLGELFPLGTAILPADTTADALSYLWDMPDAERTAVAAAARKIVLGGHTALHRAKELEKYWGTAK